MNDRDNRPEGPIEIALVGDLTENESDLCEKLLEVEPGGECILYFDSLGGSPYCAMALMSLILLRGLSATAIVAGECSSAALWPFAACRRRMVTPLQRAAVPSHEVAERGERRPGRGGRMGPPLRPTRGRHGPPVGRAVRLPTTQTIQPWVQAGRYVTGPELAEAGLAELVELKSLPFLRRGG